VFTRLAVILGNNGKSTGVFIGGKHFSVLPIPHYAEIVFMRYGRLLILRLMAAMPMVTFAQTQTPPNAIGGVLPWKETVPKYDVISVKPSRPDSPGVMFFVTPNGLNASYVTAHTLIMNCFGLLNGSEVIGEPA
jgi:hypothetical protein